MIPKKFVKDISTYVFLDVISKLIPFFAMPFLTRYLTPDDYGQFAMFNVFMGISSVFVGLSIQGVINTNFFKMDKESLSRFISNCLFIIFVSFFVILVIVLMCSHVIYLKFNIELKWQIIALLSAMFNIITGINLSLWTIEKKPIKFGVYNISQATFQSSLVLCLIIVFGMDFKGQIIGAFCGYFLFGLLSLFVLKSRGYICFGINVTYIKEALRFGIPLIPHALSGWIISAFDRLVIGNMLDMKSVGIYSVAFQFGTIMSLLVQAFNRSYIPELFKFLSKEQGIDKKIIVVKFSYICFIVFPIFSVILGTVLKYFMIFYLGSNFVESSKYVVFVCLAFSFSGCYYVVVNYIFYFKKTSRLSFLTFVGAVFYMVLAYFSIGYFGISGGVFAFGATNFLIFVFVWFYCSKIYNMPWAFWRYR